MKSGLIIFIRNPVAGKVKTRLAKTMGDVEALRIYRHLLNHTQQVTNSLPCDKILYYSDWVDKNDHWENHLFQKKLQSPGSLGERMSSAFRELFEEGYQKLLIIGSDCIELTASIISHAFNNLDNQEVVIGPSSDGGYYLLGMTRYHPFLFLHKKWSTASVLTDTLHDLASHKITVEKLVTLNDIDDEKDLPGYLHPLTTL